MGLPPVALRPYTKDMSPETSKPIIDLHLEGVTPDGQAVYSPLPAWTRWVTVLFWLPAAFLLLVVLNRS